MACRSTTTWTAGTVAAALLCALTGLADAQAPAASPSAGVQALTKACDPGASALPTTSSLPNLAAALARGKTLRILTMGAAPGRIGRRGGTYTALIERILESALKGIDVVMINRGVSGELAADAAVRMRNEVALENPDLVLWQVGTNDALAYVPVEDFAAALRDQIRWLKTHKIDVVLVGLQFAPQMLRDAHYAQIRDTLRKIAADEGVVVVRFYEALEIINKAAGQERLPVVDEFERDEAGYNCLAQYVAHAITLGAFAEKLPKAPAPKR